MSMSESDDGPILPEDTEFETEYIETQQVSHNEWNVKPLKSSKDPEVIAANQQIIQMKMIRNLSEHERTEDYLAWQEHKRIKNNHELGYLQYDNFNPVRNRHDVADERLVHLLMQDTLVQDELFLDGQGRIRNLQDLADDLKDHDDKQEQKEKYVNEEELQKIKTILNEFTQESIDDEYCAICFDKKSKNIITKCKHYFCFDCVEESLKKCGFFCPVCMSKFE